MYTTHLTASALALVALSIVQHAKIAIAHPTALNLVTPFYVPVVLGAAADFGVCAATTITSVGNTVVTGNCGTCPGTAMTGFPPGVCTGITSLGGTAACNCEAACGTAYNNAVGLVPTMALPSADLAGMILSPGVFTFPASAASNSATLTLDGAVNPLGQWIFQITTTFSTAAGSKVILINGAKACNVFFVLGSSASIGAATQMGGNIIAYTSIAIANGASFNGTLCALNGAVTFINDAVMAQAVCPAF